MFGVVAGEVEYLIIAAGGRLHWLRGCSFVGIGGAGGAVVGIRSLVVAAATWWGLPFGCGRRGFGDWEENLGVVVAAGAGAGGAGAAAAAAAAAETDLAAFAGNAAEP